MPGGQGLHTANRNTVMRNQARLRSVTVFPSEVLGCPDCSSKSIISSRFKAANGLAKISPRASQNPGSRQRSRHAVSNASPPIAGVGWIKRIIHASPQVRSASDPSHPLDTGWRNPRVQPQIAFWCIALVRLAPRSDGVRPLQTSKHRRARRRCSTSQ